MKEQRFPLTVDPVRLAKSRRELSGQVPIAQLPRLASLLADDQAEIVAKMYFDRDIQGFIVIQVSIEAELPVICQRELVRFMMPIKVETVLTPIETEQQAQRLPQQYEPVLMEEGLIVPKIVVEDELLLHMPDVPKKSDENAMFYSSGIDSQEDTEMEEVQYPFKKLSLLKSS